MVKKKQPEQPPETPQNEEPKIDEENLSPWQQANLTYMQQQGETPLWQDKKEETTEAEDTEDMSGISDEVAEKQQQKAKLKVLDSTKKGKRRKSYVETLPNLKEQTNKVLRRRIIILLLVFGIPLIILSYLVSPFSKLQNLTVSGNSEVSSDTIIASSNFSIGTNIFEEFFSREQLTAAVETDNPRIKSINVTLTGPTSLNIGVSEYQEAAVLLQDGVYYPILENGVVLTDTATDAIEGFPVLQDFSDQTIITETISGYQDIATDVQALIQVIQYTPSSDNPRLLTLTMTDGNQVLVPYTTFASQMQYYPQVASQMTENGVIDMEVGIFSYPYGTDQSTTSSTESSSESLE
ncbi:cell division protein FtsQ/DivIB [Enterococcus sp. HY326]|uniref:cell division protein FtsQ/DivIB n=1 Tax=Enterococcus sp. HY326 TaxID=2971265 RepID=UPI00223F6808|nr:cell division protein FtsQ/DivIB [Enterococcus sp. HY326]